MFGLIVFKSINMKVDLDVLKFFTVPNFVLVRYLLFSITTPHLVNICCFWWYLACIFCEYVKWREYSYLIHAYLWCRFGLAVTLMDTLNLSEWGLVPELLACWICICATDSVTTFYELYNTSVYYKQINLQLLYEINVCRVYLLSQLIIIRS